MLKGIQAMNAQEVRDNAVEVNESITGHNQKPYTCLSINWEE